jgi:hypothetical protein
VGRRPVLAGIAGEGRLNGAASSASRGRESRQLAEGARGGRGGHRPFGCRRARARGEAGELANVEAGERSRRLSTVRMQVSTCPWRPDQSNSFVFGRWPTVGGYS